METPSSKFIRNRPGSRPRTFPRPDISDKPPGSEIPGASRYQTGSRSPKFSGSGSSLAVSEPEWRPFGSDDTVVKITDPELPYRQREGVEKFSTKWGQRKLAMALIQFLTYHWDKKKVPNPKLVYVGAASGNNIEFVMKNMFPDFECHLYDPREIEVEPTDKMILYKQLFLEEDARRWSGRDDVFLVVDLRSMKKTNYEGYVPESVISEDMILQQKFYEIIKPVKAQLKFRLPYYVPGKSPRYIEYLYGLVYYQVWPGQTSTECRLVPMETPDGITKIHWDSRKHEQQLFYHNTVVREKIKFYNPFYVEGDPKSMTPVDDLELTNEYDSVAEAFLLRDYLIKMGGDGFGTEENVIALSRALTKFLTRGKSGNSGINSYRIAGRKRSLKS